MDLCFSGREETHTTYLAEQDVHWESSTRDVEYGNVAEKRCKFIRVHGGRGDDELQVGPPGDNL